MVIDTGYIIDLCVQAIHQVLHEEGEHVAEV